MSANAWYQLSRPLDFHAPLAVPNHCLKFLGFNEHLSCLDVAAVKQFDSPFKASPRAWE